MPGDDIDVFLSYSRAADEQFAPALQRGLSRLAKPWNQPSALRVFRDRTDLSAAEDLTAEIENALARSRFFVLLASEKSAGSPWVRREIEYWKRHKQPETFMIALTEGEIVWSGDDFDWERTTALPSVVSGWFPAEPIWEDFRALRSQNQRSLRHSEFRGAVASLAARPRGLSKRELDSEDVRLYRRAAALRRAATAGLVVLLVTALVMGIGFLVQRDEARRQRDRSDARAREVVAAQLIDDSERMFTGVSPGGDVEAMRRVLAADALAPGLRSDMAIVEARNRKRELVRVVDGPEYVGAAMFSADGHRVLTADRNGAVRVRDAESWRVLSETTSTVGPAPSAFSPDGERIVSCAGDRVLRARATATGAPLWEVPAIRCRTLASSGDGRIVVVDNGRAILALDSGTGTAIGNPWLLGEDRYVRALAVNRDGTRVASVDSEELRIWDVATGTTVIGPLSAMFAGQVTSVSFSPDGRRIASGSGDGTVRLWDSATGAALGAVNNGEIGGIVSVAYSPDGTRVVAGGTSGALRLWNATTQRWIGAPWPSTATVQIVLGFSPDGRRVLSRDNDGQVRVWSADWVERFGMRWLGALAVRPDGRRVVSTASGQYAAEFSTFSPGGTSVAHPVDSYVMAFNRDGTRALTFHRTGGADDWRGWRIWDTGTGELLSTSDDTEENLNVMALSPDGTRVVTNSTGGRLRLWDARTGHPLTESWPGFDEVVAGIAISPDNSRAVTVELDGTLRWWDARTGAQLGGPRETKGGIARPVFLDAHRIALARAEGALQIWDLDTGEPQSAPKLGHAPTLTGVATRIHGLAISPDGKNVVTSAEDGTIRIWDARTGAPIGAPLQGHTAAAFGVTFDVDGETVLSAGADGTVLRWPGVAPRPEDLCAKLTDDMSEAEWREWVDPVLPFRRPCPHLPPANR